MSKSKRNPTLFKQGHPCYFVKEKTIPVSDEINPQMTTRSRSIASYKDTYFIGHLGQMEQMWNDAFIQHKDSTCKQPHFTMQKTYQKIISVCMEISCTNCGFRGSPTKLYNEIQRTGRGSKTSTLNKALGVALIHSSIGPTQFSEIFLRLGIDPGSESGLQKLMNSCGPCVEGCAKENMSQERSKLKRQGHAISISCDTRYNSHMGSGNTPFQAGT